jgi:cysteinyl-tRNA synthetase
LKIYDTLSASEIALPERRAGETSIYLCGPTVYGLIHVGNARPAIMFDVLTRHLRAQGKNVVYVRNLTDVDDKIIDVALQNDELPSDVAARFIEAYHQDVAALGCVAPDHEPRVSTTMPEIIALIEALIQKGLAYEKDGNVYYATSRFEAYGKLSKRKLTDLRAGERVALDERKDDPLDFALWKASKAHEPPGARWASPWGEGRPGWHIECSAMSEKILGPGFDVHCGGLDLIFPHHENEIAQSEGATGKTLAHAWMHNGFIEFDLAGADFGDSADAVASLRESDPELLKISKSDPKRLAEIEAIAEHARTAEQRARLLVLDLKVKYAYWFQLRRVLTRVAAGAVRLWMLDTHYRSPLGFEVVRGATTNLDDVKLPRLEAAERRLEYFYETRARLIAKGSDGSQAAVVAKTTLAGKFRSEFDAALNNDLNSAQALAPFAAAFAEANRLCDTMKKATPEAHALLATIDHMCGVLGVAEGSPEAYFDSAKERLARIRGIDPLHVESLVAQRLQARTARDFARADVLRTEIAALGIEVRDGVADSRWRFIPGS